MHGRVLSSIYYDIDETRSVDDFRRLMSRFAASHGFGSSSISAIRDRPHGGSDHAAICDVPASYLECFLDDTECKRDPVMQFIKRNPIPLIWNQKTYVDAGEPTMHEKMSACGLRSGIALAIHCPDGRHIALGFDTPDLAIQRRPRQLAQLLGELQLFATHAIESAFRLVGPVSFNQFSITPSLTSRELEALKWVSMGKTAWETAQILNISERTAVKHLGNACSKLSCSSKHQAALKAAKLGIIT